MDHGRPCQQRPSTRHGRLFRVHVFVGQWARRRAPLSMTCLRSARRQRPRASSRWRQREPALSTGPSRRARSPRTTAVLRGTHRPLPSHPPRLLLLTCGVDTPHPPARAATTRRVHAVDGPLRPASVYAVSTTVGGLRPVDTTPRRSRAALATPGRLCWGHLPRGSSPANIKCATRRVPAGITGRAPSREGKTVRLGFSPKPVSDAIRSEGLVP